MKVYQDETLPIIIAYTQCNSEETGEAMAKEIKKICMEQKRKIEVIPLLAQDMKVGKKDNPIILPKYGVDKLLESSFKKIEGAVQSACFHSIREQIRTNYKASIQKKLDKVDEVLKAHLSILNNITNQIMNNISVFKSMGIDTGKNDIQYKEMEEWQKISKDEISEEFHKRIETFFNKGITKFIVTEYIKTFTDSMIKSFNETFENIDNYMVEKMGEQVQIISKKIISQFK